MLKLEVRPAPSRVMSVASPLLALGFTVLIGIVLFVLLGKDPMRGLYVFFVEPLKSWYALSELAMDMVEAFSSREELIWIQNGFKPPRQTRSAKPKRRRRS